MLVEATATGREARHAKRAELQLLLLYRSHVAAAAAAAEPHSESVVVRRYSSLV